MNNYVFPKNKATIVDNFDLETEFAYRGKKQPSHGRLTKITNSTSKSSTTAKLSRLHRKVSKLLLKSEEHSPMAPKRRHNPTA